MSGASDAQPVYLRPNFVAEPCVASWYAYSHLVSPATAAMNLKNRLVPILQDYLKHPEAHAIACRDPHLTGGPYIDLGGKRLDDIKRLLAWTLRSCAPLLALASAFEELDRLLENEADGHSMDGLYAKVPEPLRGYVELVYDVRGRSHYRIRESLLYHSRYYDRALQSLLGYTVPDDHRPFVLSTPRLDRPDGLRLNVPFDHDGIDALFEMARRARPYGEIRERLQPLAETDEIFRSFFTPYATCTEPPYEGDGARIRYFGHACVLFETKRVSILTDPVISYCYDVEPKRRTYVDLPDRIDYVIITHNHQDHVLLETMLHLRHKVRCWILPDHGASTLIDPSLRRMMRHLGFQNVVELAELDEIELPEGRLVGLPFFGEHGDLDIATKSGYLIQFRRLKVMCLADSQNLEPRVYEHLHRIIGDVEVLFLGMECNGAPVSWMYGPYFPERLEREKDISRRIAGSGCAAALDIVKRFNVRQAYVYAMGMEPWVRFLSANVDAPDCEAIRQSNEFVRHCVSSGIDSERLYVEKQILCAV